MPTQNNLLNSPIVSPLLSIAATLIVAFTFITMGILVCIIVILNAIICTTYNLIHPTNLIDSMEELFPTTPYQTFCANEQLPTHF